MSSKTRPSTIKNKKSLHFGPSMVRQISNEHHKIDVFLNSYSRQDEKKWRTEAKNEVIEQESLAKENAKRNSDTIRIPRTSRMNIKEMEKAIEHYNKNIGDTYRRTKRKSAMKKKSIKKGGKSKKTRRCNV